MRLVTSKADAVFADARSGAWQLAPMAGASFRIAACCAFIACGPARAAVFDVDDRSTVAARENSPYASIGIVNGGLFRSYSTGFLIDECHVLTVQHVLGGSRPAVGRRIAFRGGVSTPRALASKGTVIASGGFEQHEPLSQKMTADAYHAARASDWMVARLDQCIGRELGYVRLRSSNAIPLPLKSAGFPARLLGPRPMQLDPVCTVRGGNGRVLYNDCAALPGNSGSPIFREVKEGNSTVLEVYAMQSAALNTGDRAYAFHLSYANVATPMSQILRGIAHVPLDGAFRRRDELAAPSSANPGMDVTVTD